MNQGKKKESVEKISAAVRSFKKDMLYLNDIVKNQERQLEVCKSNSDDYLNLY